MKESWNQLTDWGDSVPKDCTSCALLPMRTVRGPGPAWMAAIR
ncbi:hypothetical protein [Paenibacillus lautus]